MRKTIYVIISLLLFVSCSMEQPLESKKNSGTLSLNLTPKKSRSFQMETEMNISSYDIAGIGPNGETFQSTTSNYEFIQEDLSQGDWSLTVNANDFNDEIIFCDTKEFTIIDQQVTYIDFDPNEYNIEIKERLLVSLSTAGTNIITPTFEVKLLDKYGNEKKGAALSFVNNISMQYDFLDVGYYTLLVNITENGQHKWDLVQTIFIEKASLTEEQLRTFTSAVSTISIDMTQKEVVSKTIETSKIKKSENISFSESQGTIAGSNPMLEKHNALRVEVSNPKEGDIYHWYLNGSFLISDKEVLLKGNQCDINNRLNLVISGTERITSQKIDLKSANLYTARTEEVLIDGSYNVYGSKPPRDETDFYIGKYEVSYELWYKIYNWAINNGYEIENTASEGSINDYTPGAPPTTGSTRSVCNVSWNSIIVWCNAYSEYLGLEPYYRERNDSTKTLKTYKNYSGDYSINPEANGYKLPYRKQWYNSWSYTHVNKTPLIDIKEGLQEWVQDQINFKYIGDERLMVRDYCHGHYDRHNGWEWAEQWYSHVRGFRVIRVNK